MKIIGVGISKTGTSSLAAALTELGFRCVHGWPPHALDTADALADVPAACRFRELDVMYPGSKFILTLREREAWLESCRKHWDRSRMASAQAGVKFEYFWCRAHLFGRLDFDAENHWRSYERHVGAVREYFADRPGDLLEIDIAGGEGWGPLCRFLNVAIPDKPFPWKNKSPEGASGGGDFRSLSEETTTDAGSGGIKQVANLPHRSRGGNTAGSGLDNRLAQAFQRTTGPRGMMSPTEYFRIVVELLKRAPCRLLVFGAGRDTELYVLANSGGKTVVLEHNAEWAKAVEGLDCTVLSVTYSTRLDQGFVKPCPLPGGLPTWVLDEAWDVILVDGPDGYRPDSPGRQQSVLLASVLARAGTTIFLHDYERPAEKQFAIRYLKQADEVYGSERALAVFHYTAEDVAERDRRLKPSSKFQVPSSTLKVDTSQVQRPKSKIESDKFKVQGSKFKVDRSAPLKVFVLGVPHTQTTRAFNTCPFTIKAWNQCRMLHRRGHEVIHIGVEGSDPECSENVAAISHAEWSALYAHPGAKFYTTKTDGPFAEYQELYARRVREAIDARVTWPWKAIVCCTWGDAQRAATRGLSQFVVESGIGYRHTWAKYRVFISYAWMHFHYGREGKHTGNGWYDVVIPNAVDPGLFDFRPQDKSDEFLFLGRLNDDKGVAIAIDVARRVGRRIAIVGQGDPARFLKDNPHVRYVPAVDVEGRRKLMAEAAALFCPTHYIEPLGNVALEAQISGTPVIATDWGGFTETVLHGVTGYRCRTLEQFVWSAKNIEQIDPATCRKWVLDNFSSERVGPMFEEYYRMLLDLAGDGWNAEHPERTQLDWLARRWPAVLIGSPLRSPNS